MSDCSTRVSDENPVARVRKSQQLVLRIDPEQKALLERAAAVSGRSVTDIMTEGGRERALRILEEDAGLRSWVLSRSNAQSFVECLLAPREPDSTARTDF